MSLFSRLLMVRGKWIILYILMLAMMLVTFPAAVQAVFAPVFFQQDILPAPPDVVTNTGGEIVSIWWQIQFDSSSVELPLAVRHIITDPAGNVAETHDYTIADMLIVNGDTIYNSEQQPDGGHMGAPGFEHPFVVPAGATPGIWKSRVEYYSTNMGMSSPDSLSERTFAVSNVTYTTIDQPAVDLGDGVSADITGSTAPGETNVTLAFFDYGNWQPTGTGAIQVGLTHYYDIQVTSDTDLSGAMAVISITSPDVTAGSSIRYWDGTNWLEAEDISISGQTISGKIPVEALGGTPVELTMPGSPVPGVPEIPAGILLGAGLAGIGVFFLIKKTRSANPG
jgi:hypothetical protein